MSAAESNVRRRGSRALSSGNHHRIGDTRPSVVAQQRDVGNEALAVWLAARGDEVKALSGPSRGVEYAYPGTLTRRRQAPSSGENLDSQPTASSGERNART
jgi:hypothetical protein